MKKRIAIILAAALLLVAVSTTAAFLIDRTPPMTNNFKPVSVTCKVLETFDTEANVKSDVSVQNTGDISAYVRAMVVATWVSEENGNVYGTAPVWGEDYTVVEGQPGWEMGSDGFYYCNLVIAAGGKTPTLFSTVTPVDGRTPEGYRLAVQIIASAIQAEPAEAVKEAWGNVPLICLILAS